MRISLIPQKNFLFGIALNLLPVRYSLHQLPSEKLFKKGHYELNIYLPVLHRNSKHEEHCFYYWKQTLGFKPL